MTRPLLWTELHPPDALGRSELRCYLTKLGPLTRDPQVIEELGFILYHAYPEKSYETSGWLGEEGDRHLRVTLPNGRVLEVCAVAATFAKGGWPHRKQHEKKKRPKPREPKPKAGADEAGLFAEIEA